MARAAGVVAMGGYNTFCEILSFDKRALIVPRTAPRLEQFIRTQRAAELGLLTMLSERGRPRPAGDGDGAPPPDASASAFRHTYSRPPRRHGQGQSAGAELARSRAARLLRGPRALRNLSVAAPCRPTGRVAFVLKGYPRLSETFIAQEILALERAWARDPDRLLTASDGSRPTSDHRLDPCSAALPAGVPLSRATPGLAGLACLAPTARIPSGSRSLARRPATRSNPKPHPPLRPGIGIGSRTPARRRPAACAFSAHASLRRPLCGADRRPRLDGLGARQGHLDPADWEKRTKLAEAGWAVTCTEAARAIWRAWPPAQHPSRCVITGSISSGFRAHRAARDRCDGADRRYPVTILSVGRAVRKKGYDDLLEALALLPSDLEWRFVHVGGGVLAPALKRQAERLGLSQRVEWRGARTQPEVLAAYREADLFVLACKIAEGRRP